MCEFGSRFYIGASQYILIPFQCLAECILNGTGHGDLNPDKMVTDALKDAEDQGIAAEWSPIIKDMTKYCFDEGTKRMPELEAGFKLPPLDPADQVCHPKYAFGMMCSLKKMLAVSGLLWSLAYVSLIIFSSTELPSQSL